MVTMRALRGMHRAAKIPASSMGLRLDTRKQAACAGEFQPEAFGDSAKPGICVDAAILQG
jgi:hypothetical protein